MISKISKQPKVALIYDRINTSYGGAEHLLKAITEIYPSAPLFTSVYCEKKAKWAKNLKILTSFLQKIKFLRNRHQLFAFLMPLAFESLDLDGFDIVISITSAEAKGVLTKPNQLHICYMLTPTRYLYSHQDQYLNSKTILKYFPIKQISKLIINYLKWWDKVAIYRADQIIPISKLVKSRIKQFYGQDSQKVIYPPANLKLRTDSGKKINSDFYLSISRLVAYKKVDLSIQAALELNKTLVVVGTGIQKNELYQIAAGNYLERINSEPIDSLLKRAENENKKIIFTNKISENELNELLSSCKALIMPGEEDFGITGLEASIFGKPVIVFYKSGVAELLNNGLDSVFTYKQNKHELVKAIKQIENTIFDTDQIKANAKKHSTDEFKKQFEKRVSDNWKIFTQ